ncbi:sorting nexin-2-like isoform X2 [Ischnura elegans]|uniref:sorting nexin-2-like isoform X2 n=1 Tax=Ischnura elegans TaxID=197161 RepID=UPI001ED869D7|nr:sorting nexin-2-like isoform X2 [Ischnura elegans]
MAEFREPPPLFDSEKNCLEDDNDDLFQSAVETQSSNVKGSPNHSPFENGEEIDLKRDEKTEDGSLFTDAFNGDEPFSSNTTPADVASRSDNTVQPPPLSKPEAKVSSWSSSGPDVKGTDEEVEEEEVPRPAPKAHDEHTMEIRVQVAQRAGEGMSAYMLYRVCTCTNIPLFRRPKSEVMRRFSDFLGLHDKLVAKYLRSGRIIPPAPEKSIVGMTKIKMSSSLSPTEQPGTTTSPTGSAGAASGGGGGGGGGLDFLERRRAALERYLQRTANHPVLRVDPDVRDFLESDAELPKATNTSALSGAGVLRLFNKVGGTVNKMTYKMEENDLWFEEKVQEIESLESAVRELLSATEALVLHRRDLAAATGALARSAAVLSNCEEHTSLSRSLSQLADIEEKIEILHYEQANSDSALLCELMKDYVALIGAVKDVFHERVKVYQNWQHSQLTLTKKREAKAKLDLSGKTDKSSLAAEEVSEWEAKVERGQEEFNNISSMIKKEMEMFESQRVRDFKETLVKYLENLLGHQQQLIKFWEIFLPEAKAIA